jgi:hypothetical protein
MDLSLFIEDLTGDDEILQDSNVEMQPPNKCVSIPIEPVVIVDDEISIVDQQVDNTFLSKVFECQKGL